MASDEQKSDTNASQLNSQALALAEQLGRIAGTLEGTAEAWLNRATLAEQLTKVRDGATQLLNSLSGAAKGKKASASGSQSSKGKGGSPGRSARVAAADPAHAPGKQHRKPSPSLKGAKHSDARIPKAKASAAARRRRKSYA
jgi:hypothetical protein